MQVNGTMRGMVRRGCLTLPGLVDFIPLLAVSISIAGAGCSDTGRVSGGACLTNSNCPTGEQCISGRCVAASAQGCKSDDACPIGEFCNPTTKACERMEITGCTTDDACPPDQRCNTLTGACIVGRRSCIGEEQCAKIDKHCDLTIQQCVECLESAQCSTPMVCLDGSCMDPAATTCLDDSACSVPSSVCQTGQCVPGCHRPGSPILCGLGEVCDDTSGRCMPGETSCMNDQGCTPPATICESGQCIPGCTQVGGLTCTGGNVCDSTRGRCVPPAGCASDMQCGAPAAVCELGQCVPGCSQPGGLRCSTGTVCDSTNGRCVTVQGPCSSDSQCGPPTGVCELGQCVPGCGQSGGIQCSGNTICNTGSGRCDPGGMVCTSDGECNPPGTICDLGSGACVPGCGTTGCAAPLVCTPATGRCDNPMNPMSLALNAVCTANPECASGVCFDFEGMIGKRCVESCGSSLDCPSAFTCYDFQGAKMCISSQLFTDATFASGNGAACATGGECHSNYCPSSSCVDTCNENTDCGGAQCKWNEFTTDRYIGSCDGPAGSGANGAMCTADTDCRSGVCYGTGTCGDLCGSSSDCPNDSVCVLVNYSVCVFQFVNCFGWQPNFVKACVQSTHGADVVGAACTTADNCRSGLCLTSAGQCTDTCSRDLDCPTTHVCGVEQYGELPVEGGDPVKIFINICKQRGS